MLCLKCPTSFRATFSICSISSSYRAYFRHVCSRYAAQTVDSHEDRGCFSCARAVAFRRAAHWLAALLCTTAATRAATPRDSAILISRFPISSAIWCSTNPAVARTRDTIFHSEEMWWLVTVMYPSIARLVHMSVDNQTERTALPCSFSFTSTKPATRFFRSSNEMFVAEDTR